MTAQELMEQAKKMISYAYAPYSGFCVGAAIETRDGAVYTGCNVENASYGASVCAERTAAVKAVSEGHTGFLKIAIASSSGRMTYPCGICRQFLSEFFDPEGTVILEDGAQGLKEVSFAGLFPDSFQKDCLK